MNIKKLAAAGLIFVSTSFGASAATFDFVDLIDGPGGVDGIANGAGDINGESSWSDSLVSGGWTKDGITLDVTASGSEWSDGFLDAGAAGLGVCSSEKGCVSGDSGAVTGDDNLGFVGGASSGVLETLFLTFSKEVRITDLILRDADHNELVDGDLFWIAELGGELAYTAGGVDLSGLGAYGMFTIERRINSDGSAKGPELYISAMTVSAIPLPAGSLLLITGMGGIAALRRRRKS